MGSSHLRGGPGGHWRRGRLLHTRRPTRRRTIQRDQVATSLGTAVVDGKTVPHVALAFQTYPDSTGSVGRQAGPSQRQPELAGLRIHQPVPGAGPRAGDRDHPPVRLGRLAQQPVLRHVSGARWEGPPSPHRQADGHVAWDPNNIGHTFTMRGVPGWIRTSSSMCRSPARSRGQRPDDAGQHYTVVFSFMSGSKGTYAWNCEFPCGSMVAGFGG